MMVFNTIDYKKQGNWVEIALDRPHVFNALNKEMLTELMVAFSQAEQDEDIRCIVFTGNGKAFCSGQDLKAFGTGLNSIPFGEIIRTHYNPLTTKMRNCKKPIICKLNGLAVGAGCSLALAADMVIASKEAYLAEIFSHIGLVMDGGSTYFLLKKVGYVRAYEMATTGKKVFADEAEQMGLINKSVDPSALEDAVQQYVDVYTNASSVAIGLIKEMLNKSQEMTLEEVLEMEAVYQQKAGESKDFKEGVLAFLEKRKPDFNR
ncbi:2-(1,2-epoxy-1,2-dihydrophenyl)acetyl-CoA isomerase PaaG [Echinicola sediminis]